MGDRLLSAGERGDADALRESPGGGFVAHHVEQFRARSDKRDAGLGAGTGEVRVLGKKTVARMNRVHAFFLGDGDDALDVEIRGDRAFVLAN